MGRTTEAVRGRTFERRRGVKRLRMFYIDPDNLLGCIAGQFRICNLPEGCKFARASFLWDRNVFGIIVSHDSFDEVAEGSQIPLFDFLECECVTESRFWQTSCRDPLMVQTHDLGDGEKKVKFREFL